MSCTSNREKKYVRQTVDLRRSMHIYALFITVFSLFCDDRFYLPVIWIYGSHFICNGFHTYTLGCWLLLYYYFHYFRMCECVCVCVCYNENKQKCAKMHAEKILPSLSDCGIKWLSMGSESSELEQESHTIEKREWIARLSRDIRDQKSNISPCILRNRLLQLQWTGISKWN